MKNRIGFLDAWRAAALLAMIVWHFLYDLSAAGLLPPSLPQNGVMELFRLLIAGSFVSISGVCAALSRRPLRRGLIVFAAALLVSAVTDLFGTPVRWGILHLLGTCMMLYAAVGKRLAALPAAAAAAKRLEELPPEEKFTPAPRFFAWLSRRSLAVYLLHQPVLLAVTALLESATRGT